MSDENAVVEQHASTKIDFKPVTLSEKAKAHVLKYLAQKPDCIGMHLGVKTTGCSGLSYVVDYCDSAKDMLAFKTDEVSVYVKATDMVFLSGVQIDFVKDGLNEKFIFTNPNETGQCGCGESFTV